MQAPSRDIPRSPARSPVFGRPPRVVSLERAVAGRGRVDPWRASGGDVEVGLDHGHRRGAFVAGDVHVPEAWVEEAGAGPVDVRRARRVVAVVDGERPPGDDDERRAGVGVPAGRAAGSIVVVRTTVSVGFAEKILKPGDVGWYGPRLIRPRVVGFAPEGGVADATPASVDDTRNRKPRMMMMRFMCVCPSAAVFERRLRCVPRPSSVAGMGLRTCRGTGRRAVVWRIGRRGGWCCGGRICLVTPRW
jgi:hypothetical protein